MINFLILANQKFKHISEEKIIQKLKELDTKYGHSYKFVMLYPITLSSAASDNSMYYNKLTSICLANENNSFYSKRNIENLLRLDRESGGIIQI